MKTVEAYQTSDGRFFASEKSAKAHEDDLIGQELDDFFKLTGMHSDCGHHAIFKACIKAIADKKQLRDICANIVAIIDFESGYE
jgi:hypothetical protein